MLARDRPAYHHSLRMAVVIASDLGKDIAGEPLLRGISFKLERRDRMTLSGRNGAGKTTLLRMLAGEASIDFGELVLAKGTKIALHDQRPPRERELSLRDYVLSGRARAGRDRAASWPRSSRRWPAGAHDEATLGRYAEAQARLEHAGGYGWRDRALAALHGLGLSRRRRPRPSAGDVLWRGADARLARAGARRRPRSSAARRADQPPRHRVARVARAAPRRASTPRSCWWRTTAGSSRRSAPRCSSSRPAAASSSKGRGTRGARRRPRASWRSAARSSASRPRSSGSSGS